MRTPIRRVATLVTCIALAACSSGTVYVVHRPAPPPPPPAPRLHPLEITLARPVRGQLVVQTNRPSYVALFEIVPERGVALLAPSYAHQRTWMLAGLNWVPVSWKVQSTMYYGRPSATAVPARWVYAIASDEPLRLPDEAFHPSYMRRVLGPAAYRGTNPYVTMRAIARAFVPSVIDEAWAEDAYALAATYASDPYRTVRIYCANRTVYEVPEEMADRAWCPVHAPSGGTIVRSVPTRPDSIVVGNGQRVRRRMPETTPVRSPIDRVMEPTRPEYAPVVTDNPPRTDNANNGVTDAKEKEKRNNGNAYGHTDDPNVKGRGIENEKQNDPRRQPRVDTPVNVQTETDKQAEKVEAKQQRLEEKQLRQDEKLEEKQVRQEQKQEQKSDRAEQKAEHKAEKAEHKAEKPEQKPEQKPEHAPAMTVEPPRQAEPPVAKPETAPVQKQEAPAQPEAKPEQDSKPEAKAESKEEKAEAKAEDKAGGKPEEKTQGKPDMRPPGIKNQKSKP
ncbi:MAG TPA: hypothetical protein VJ650_17045 [Gemmatimonadaceae bacterium]|nr:hypothetical protein [Gemmatimonadaceae bacterium]